jgi:putative ABC transport system permease protein
MVFATRLDIRALSLSIFDRTLAVTYALEAAAVVIGLLGLSSAIGGQVIVRRREFGLLRHLGVTRRQIATMLAAEGLTATAAGLLVGYGLGFAIGLVLIHVVIFGVAMLASAAITSLVSGRRALATDAVRAVREDW